jgi:hypothetical protein
LDDKVLKAEYQREEKEEETLTSCAYNGRQQEEVILRAYCEMECEKFNIS